MRLKNEPLPDLVVTLSSYYEFRSVAVYNPRALVAPPENRIGRKIGDVLPSNLVEDVLRGTYRAVRDTRPALVPYVTPRGTFNHGIITVPNPDLILISVRQLA